MQVIILAAGMGSRLGKYTKDNTKCMLEVNSKPLIMHTLENIYQSGVKSVVIVVGYKRENLIDFVGNVYKDVSIEYVINDVYDKTNNIYSLYLTKDVLLKSDSIIIESDLIFDVSILKNLINDPRSSLAVVDKYQHWMDGTSVLLDSLDNIVSFIPKKVFNFNNANDYYKTVNIYKFSKDFSRKTYVPFLEAYLTSVGDNEYYEQVLKVVTAIDNQELKALKLSGEKWYEIDDIQDKDNAEVIFSHSDEKLRLIQRRYGGYWRYPEVKDFCYLVNPYFPNKKIVDELQYHFYDLLSQYPSGLNIQNLLAAKMFNIDDINIVVGNGATEIIKILHAAIDGTFGIMCPTFDEYIASIGLDRVVTHKVNKACYTIEDLKELSLKVDNLILINPDNPTGQFIKIPDLINLIDFLSSYNKNIIVDESFVDFSTNGESDSLISQSVLDTYKNLIVIKSISKSYGVPGLRLGVVASSNLAFLEKVKKLLPIWNINSIAEYFLQIIGKYKKEYKNSCEDLKQERERFYRELSKISFLSVQKSESNFFICEVLNKFSASELSKLMINRNIYIKDLTGKVGVSSELIRISIRDKKDNNFLLEKINEVFENE